MQRVLFLCTGNYYRSRFAEIVFNWNAKTHGGEWRADSRGLAVSDGNVGPVSPHTLRALQNRDISCETLVRFPAPVAEADFAAASHIVAVKESEHLRMICDRFPEWVDRVEYWHIDDLDCATADLALPNLEAHVGALFERLTAA